MSLIAVTGGIGAGKTTLLRFFAEAGGRIADADDVAHDVYLPGKPAHAAMVSRWGETILSNDGQIARAEVAKRVFGQAEELAWLNNLVHPLIRQELLRLSQEPGPHLFCAIPLLYETHWEPDCAKVVSAWCPADVQLQRLRARGWSDEEIQRRLATQLSMDEKLRRADYGILTNCTWECLREQCQRTYSSICNALPL